jgi:dihydrofolate reductase
MSETTTTHEVAGAAGGGGRPVVVTTFLTLDGYMVGPDEDMSWVAEGLDPRMQADLAEAMAGWGTFLFGRVTFDIFAAYWPHAVPYDEGEALNPSGGREDARIIRALNERPKVVFSTTLASTDWANTRIVAGGPEDEVRRLKAEPGGPINVQGSASIVRALARADLVDEYVLYVHPVLLGAGTQLFGPGTGRQDLELVGSTMYDNGVVALTHRRRRP